MLHNVLSLDGDGERILMFGSQWSLIFLSYCSRCHADGTFLTRPLLFAQIYIIFGYFDGFLVPCIYCLTSRQNQVTYEKLFNHLISIGLTHLQIRFSLEALTCDFELGSINASTYLFPNIDIAACFFSFFTEIMEKNNWSKTQQTCLSIKEK